MGTSETVAASAKDAAYAVREEGALGGAATSFLLRADASSRQERLELRDVATPAKGVAEGGAGLGGAEPVAERAKRLADCENELGQVRSSSAGGFHIGTFAGIWGAAAEVE